MVGYLQSGYWSQNDFALYETKMIKSSTLYSLTPWTENNGSILSN